MGAMTARTTTTPTLECPCGARIELVEKRIGDEVTCVGCGKLRVVIRSKVTGEVPAAGANAARAASDRLAEVQVTLDRIRVRRAGRAARDVALHPTWSIFVSALVLGVYVGGYLATQNLVALGKLSAARAARSVVLLTLAHAGLFVVFVGWSTGWFDPFNVPKDASIPALGWALRAAVFGYSSLVVLVLPLAITASAAPIGRVARESGARSASPLIPMLVGFLLLIAQLFAVLFVRLASSPF